MDELLKRCARRTVSPTATVVPMLGFALGSISSGSLRNTPAATGEKRVYPRTRNGDPKRAKSGRHFRRTSQ